MVISIRVGPGVYMACPHHSRCLRSLLGGEERRWIRASLHTLSSSPGFGEPFQEDTAGEAQAARPQESTLVQSSQEAPSPTKLNLNLNLHLFHPPPMPSSQTSILPVPNLPQECSHINLLGLHLYHPRMLQHPPRRSPPFRLLLQTTLDEILEALPPLDIILWLILQLRDRLPHNIRQQIDEPGPRLHLRPVGGEGEPVLGYFQEGHPEGPHVRGDGVGLALDALWSHVVGGADESGGLAFRAKLAGYPEIA